ncbi:MAG: hypothetical protein EXR21_06710 [Flavobacteriaceae bacterium]|nr:hypothetical protein [Flavobacteriaceae bacterium]
MPGRVSGTDPEDGLYAGSTGSNGLRTIVFTALPNFTNTVLVYFNGTSNILLIPNPSNTDPSFTYWNVTASRYEIPSFDASVLKVFLKNNGNTNFQFEYA